MALSQFQILVILGISFSIVLLYILYLVFRVNCKLDTSIKPLSCKTKTRKPVNVDEYPSNPQPQEPQEPTSLPDCVDYASDLTKRLMNSAQRITNERGLDDRYRQRLLLEIYQRFTKLNENLIGKHETRLSQRFLDQIKRKIKAYEQQIQRGEIKVSNIQDGGANLHSDLNRILEESANIVYRIFPGLEN
jgi:hypothetical protein